MLLFTVQWHLGRKLPESFQFLNTTVKFNRTNILSPNWEMVMGIKTGKLDEVGYTQQYKGFIWRKIKNAPDIFESYLRQEVLTVGCLCRADKFCHRLILVDVIRNACQKRNIPFAYGGEVTVDNQVTLIQRIQTEEKSHESSSVEDGRLDVHSVH